MSTHVPPVSTLGHADLLTTDLASTIKDYTTTNDFDLLKSPTINSSINQEAPFTTDANPIQLESSPIPSTSAFSSNSEKIAATCLFSEGTDLNFMSADLVFPSTELLTVNQDLSLVLSVDNGQNSNNVESLLSDDTYLDFLDSI